MEPGWKAPVDTRPLKPEKVLKAFEAQIQISELGDQLEWPLFGSKPGLQVCKLYSSLMLH